MKKYSKRIKGLIAATLITSLFIGPVYSQEHREHGSVSGVASQPPRQGQVDVVGWTKFPAIIPAGRGERGTAVLTSINSKSPELSAISPDTTKSAATFLKVGGKWTIKQPDAEVGGYHLLLAKEESATEIRTASTLWMFQSKPQSPEKMLASGRPGLEIQPLKLPQFGGFREGQTGEFVILFNGIPVPDSNLTIDTENGTHETVLANKNGVARVLFPRDFDPEIIEKEGGAARTRRSFVLGVELKRNGIQHTTGLSLPYLPDLMRERNLMAGAGLFAFGMLLATPMLRRKKESSNV
ncbi:MAG: hypothetical protein Q8S26_12565 [Azonexus sp.]|nr:hypothetical protein [Azonexus sp.]